MERKDLKTITIHQGQGDDELEMIVQVTQEELDKMEELRGKNPLVWKGKELDLLKTVKKVIETQEESNGESELVIKKKKNLWLLGGSLLGLVVAVVVLALSTQKNDNGVRQESNEIALNTNNTSLDFSPVSSDIEGFKKVYEIACSYGMTDSFDDMVSYLSLSEENRRKFYDKLVSFGMPDSFDDFCAIIGYPVNNQQQSVEDNLKSVYNKLIELGSSGSFDDFVAFFKENDENKKRTYEKCKENGYTGTYEQFLEYTGYSIDWKKVLDDFIAIKKVYPNLTVNEWFERFPEFNDDENLLQAAFDYDATVKSGKYSDENELRSKFPEFWPNSGWNSKASQNIMNLYDHLRDEQLFVGTLDNFQNSLMSELYRNTLYQFLSEKQVFDESYSLFCEELGLTTYTPSLFSDYKRTLYDILTLYNYDLGDYETFSQKMNDDTKRRAFYDAVSEEYDLGSWENFSEKMGITISTNDYSSTFKQKKTFSSIQYGFTYQYDDKEFDLVEKANKNTHCVMKLQSPKDEIKSILISVWENSDFSSAYDPDFIESCQSVDQGLGSVIKSATKTKVGGVNALKSELTINPMGKSYYTAIYRIIHKKRMYMLNIYIPIEEYNNDKSFGDKCANNFKFN